jgi:cyclopropane fatty-acyl-phospholipid synthase-like methyltransferase
MTPMKSKREIVRSFLRDALLRGRPRSSDGILVYDALQVAPALEWNEAGYLNFGLWEEDTASTLEASESLLERVADRAGLAEAERVLDVGFGTGAQTLYFAGRTAGSIVGVNQSASQTESARERVRAAGLAERAHLLQGDATALDLPAEGFDAVTCVEAAFHFAPRERFFREAYRVLAPGGRLVLADILPSAQPHWSHGLFWSFFHRLFFVPRENWISLEAYRDQLKRCGFDVRVEVVTHQVYVPFFANRARAYEWWAAIGLCQLLVRWFRWRSPCEYVIAVATK